MENETSEKVWKEIDDLEDKEIRYYKGVLNDLSKPDDYKNSIRELLAKSEEKKSELIKKAKGLMSRGL